MARPAVSLPHAGRDGLGVVFVGLAGSRGDVEKMSHAVP